MTQDKKPFFDQIQKSGEILVGFFFILLSASVSIQVISRYFFNHAFGWGEEFPIFIFLWVSFLAAAISYRDGNHLSVDFVADRLPKKMQRPLTYINLILSLVFVLVLFFYESKMTLLTKDSTFVVMKISKAFCYVGIPISCLLFAVFIIEKLIAHLRSATIQKHPPNTD